MLTAEIRATGPTIDHSTYVGASDIAAVVGISPYKTALDVWAEKTGRAKFEGNRPTRAGQVLEPGILALYAEEQGVDLWFPGSIRRDDGTGCTPDAVSSAGYDVQVKLVGVNQAKRWGDVHDGDGGIPPEVLAQIHYEAWHLREMFGVHDVRGHAVAQIGTDQRVFDVSIDHEYADALVELGRRFWRDHVVADCMPEVGEASRDTLQALFPRVARKELSPMTEEVALLAHRYRALADSGKEISDERERVAGQLCALIGDGSGLVSVSDGLRVTWNEQRGRVNWEKCARALGATEQIAEAFRGGAHRVLRVAIKER